MTAKSHIPALLAWALLQSAVACDTGDVCIAVRPCDNAQNIGTMDRKLDELQAALNSLKEQNADSELKNLTEQKHQLQTSFNQLQTSFDQLQTSFDQLQTYTTNYTTALKRRLCESYGMTFDGGAGVCYYFSNGTNTWDQARQDCINRQSDLIIINSQEKQDLGLRLSDSARRLWIGLTDRETEGVFKWVDGTPLTTPTFWASGEPNNAGGDEHCTHLWTHYRIWNDFPCSNVAYWICERAV